MINRVFFLGPLLGVMALGSCASHYELTSVSRSRVLIDSTYDQHPDVQGVVFLAPYKHVVDSVTRPVVGSVSEYLAAHRPESNLSNLLADILVWGGTKFNEHPVFSVYNMGGIRAALSKGTVTYGDIVDIAPFDNKICFLTLSGKDVLELFQQIAKRGGEGISHGVNLQISTDGKLLDARIDGKEIDLNAFYRVATLDYLAQGNDELTAFKSGTNVISLQEEGNNIRYIIMDYFRINCQGGKSVCPVVEGRIKIIK
ncbi:MAG TPA: hypothetical protein DCS83_05040 [Prevotella sp.]|nr:hypothetical protein [Prevotella sp.]